MIKGIILGALIVVGMVGYGVITPEALEEAGDRVKTGINNSAAWVKEQTDPDLVDQVKDKLK